MKNNSLFNLLNQKSIKYLFNLFEKKSQNICLVGGCVRDALLGIEIKDIDVAANIEPDEIIGILKKKNISYKSFAYKYGSVLAVINNQKFQITTLRKDINQNGRDTNIIFTKDWQEDASRRDFTINAMYLSNDGTLKDYFNGFDDLSNYKLKFIGNIEDRIQEDFLRIFRYYRFLGLYEKPELNTIYESILDKYYNDSFIHIPNDLLRQEILKMFKTPFPLNCFFINKKQKKRWVQLTTNHFIETKYDIGLNKCLDKIDLFLKNSF